MKEWLVAPAELVTPANLAHAASAYCCRCGKPQDEVSRRGRLRAVQRLAGTLAMALEEFRRKGAVHLRVVVSTQARLMRGRPHNGCSGAERYAGSWTTRRALHTTTLARSQSIAG